MRFLDSLSCPSAFKTRRTPSPKTNQQGKGSIIGLVSRPTSLPQGEYSMNPDPKLSQKLQDVLSDFLEELDHDVWKAMFLPDEGDFEIERIERLEELKQSLLTSLVFYGVVEF